MRVIYADVRALDYCLPGVRRWFKENGLNFDVFMKEGIELSELEHLTDPMAIRVLEQAKKRALANG